MFVKSVNYTCLHQQLVLSEKYFIHYGAKEQMDAGSYAVKVIGKAFTFSFSYQTAEFVNRGWTLFRRSKKRKL